MKHDQKQRDDRKFWASIVIEVVKAIVEIVLRR